MSGSWVERVEAGQPLKPADLAAALKDLAAGLRAVQAAIVELDERDAALAGRLSKVEGPVPVKAVPAKAARPAADGSP